MLHIPTSLWSIQGSRSSVFPLHFCLPRWSPKASLRPSQGVRPRRVPPSFLPSQVVPQGVPKAFPGCSPQACSPFISAFQGVPGSPTKALPFALDNFWLPKGPPKAFLKIPQGCSSCGFFQYEGFSNVLSSCFLLVVPSCCFILVHSSCTKVLQYYIYIYMYIYIYIYYIYIYIYIYTRVPSCKMHQDETTRRNYHKETTGEKDRKSFRNSIVLKETTR